MAATPRLRKMTTHLLAQSNDSAAAVLGLLLGLALIGLQIYLIYAIIATRQDVKLIRQWLQGGPAPRSGGIHPQEPMATPPRSDDLDRLREVANLRQGGILTEDEFVRLKEGILGESSEVSPFPPAPSAEGSRYVVIVRDFGSADLARLNRVISSHLDDLDHQRLETVPCVVATEIGFATAEPLRAGLRRRARPLTCKKCRLVADPPPLYHPTPTARGARYISVVTGARNGDFESRCKPPRPRHPRMSLRYGP